MENSYLKQMKGFSRLGRAARLQKLQDLGFLSEEDSRLLNSAKTPPLDLAEDLIENVLGWFGLPLGLAVNFIINGRPRVLPLAVEETSIIAAASKTARWVSANGEIKAGPLGTLSTGQMQMARVKNPARLKKAIEENFPKWKKNLHSGLLASMAKRGGGLKGWELRLLDRPESGAGASASGKAGGAGRMAVLHLFIETCDAMGANLINQVCESLKPPLERLSGEQVSMSILSNLADRRLARARVILRGQEAGLIRKIEEASLFAETDPYRAATNNKGVLNGIDGLLIATGNDWRAVEAGLHAYACRSGSYSSLTKWRVRGGELHGELTGPFMVGAVGGVTNSHPMAHLCLKILGFPKGPELASLCCALGLIQNLGALRALVTEGVIEGHMKLHIKNIALKTGAGREERPFLEEHLTHVLKEQKTISLARALKDLNHWRKHHQWL